MISKALILLLFSITSILGNAIPPKQDELLKVQGQEFNEKLDAKQPKLRSLKFDTDIQQEIEQAKEEVSNFERRYDIWLSTIDLKLSKIKRDEQDILSKLWGKVDAHKNDKLNINREKLKAVESKWEEMKAKIQKTMDTDKKKIMERWTELKKLGKQLSKQGEMLKDSNDEVLIGSWRNNIKLWRLDKRDFLEGEVAKYGVTLRVLYDTLGKISKSGFNDLIGFDDSGEVVIKIDNIEVILGGALKTLSNAGVVLTDTVSNTVSFVVKTLNSAIDQVEKLLKAGRDTFHNVLYGSINLAENVVKGGIGTAHKVVHGATDLVGGILSTGIHGILGGGHNHEDTHDYK